MAQFSYTTRVIRCANCTAPLASINAAARAQCDHCGAPNIVVPRRVDSDLVRVKSVSSGAVRLERLRHQATLINMIPPTLDHLVIFGKIHPSKLKDAEQLLASSIARHGKPTRLRGQHAELEETIFFLTMLLAEQCPSDPEGGLLKRSYYEASLDVIQEGSYRDYLYGSLSRAAAKEQDLVSAHAWLDLIHPLGDDIRSHSAYRVSVAYLATWEQDFHTVIEALGREHGYVPMINEMDALTSLLRINAYEMLGDQDTANWQMKKLAEGPLASLQTIYDMTEPTPPPVLCQRARAMVLPEREAQPVASNLESKQNSQKVRLPAKVLDFEETGISKFGEYQLRLDIEVWTEEGVAYQTTLLEFFSMGTIQIFSERNTRGILTAATHFMLWVNRENPLEVSFS